MASIDFDWTQTLCEICRWCVQAHLLCWIVFPGHILHSQQIHTFSTNVPKQLLRVQWGSKVKVFQLSFFHKPFEASYVTVWIVSWYVPDLLYCSFSVSLSFEVCIMAVGWFWRYLPIRPHSHSKRETQVSQSRVCKALSSSQYLALPISPISVVPKVADWRLWGLCCTVGRTPPHPSAPPKQMSKLIHSQRPFPPDPNLHHVSYISYSSNQMDAKQTK